MPANSTTRRGNGAGGAGWGGPAKGSGNREAGPGRGHTTRTVAEIMAAQGARELAAQRWLEILQDPAHPRHAEMVAKAADRMDGAPKQPFEGPDGGPLVGACLDGFTGFTLGGTGGGALAGNGRAWLMGDPFQLNKVSKVKQARWF